MPDSNPTTLLLAVPGPEQYTAVPKTVVRKAIKQRQIRQSQLIWSPVHNDWMELRNLPHLHQDTQALQPAPPLPKPGPALSQPPKTQTLQAPSVPERTPLPILKASGPLPKASSAGVSPKAVEGKLNPVSPHARDLDHEEGFPLFKILSIVLFFSLIGLVGSNYLLVDQSQRNNFARTAYQGVTVHAHLVGFYQPDALVIHLFPSAQVKDAGLLDFLTALAQSTPRTALKGDLFETVGLTPAYSVRYAIRGQDWNQFALMTQASELERKTFLLQHLTDENGAFLMPLSGGMEATAEDNPDDRVKVAWQKLTDGLLH